MISQSGSTPTAPTTLLRTIPALPVVDMAEGVDFYTLHLGFRCLGASDEFAMVARDGAEIHLWLAADDSWRHRSREAGTRPVVSGAETFIAGTASCRIEVRNLDALYDELRGEGVLYDDRTQVETRPWGQRDFAVLDPWRNLITFYESAEVVGA